jgi:hypothetical protein
MNCPADELDKLIAYLRQVRGSTLYRTALDTPPETWSRETREDFTDLVLDVAEAADPFFKAASKLVGNHDPKYNDRVASTAVHDMLLDDMKAFVDDEG